MPNETDAVILVVEDDDTLSLLTQKQLTRLGYRTDCASDGRDALKMMQQNNYSLILMDVQMPIMDGIEAATAIREWEEADAKEHVPIVAMTANPDRQRCVDAGMDDFIFKPVMLDQLERLVARWLAPSPLSGRDTELSSGNICAVRFDNRSKAMFS